MTLGGKPSKNLQPIKETWTPKPMDKKATSQIKVGETAEGVREKKLEDKKCPMCKRLVEKYLDICEGKSNMDICVDCIRERHNLTGPGFTDQGDRIQFWSHTTGMEVIPYENITKVFVGICFPNPVFLYCINYNSYKHADGTVGNGCLGVTTECGKFLIEKLQLKKTSSTEEEDEEWVR